MFETDSGPRLYGLPPGADFPLGVLKGLEVRLIGQPPEAWARVEIFVNTRRMQRRLKTLFDDGPARLLPRLRLVTDLAEDTLVADIPPPASPLRRRLELTQLIAKLLDKEPDLAPRGALFDLADSLATLMDEMQGEGVPPEKIRALDVSDQSGHWQRSLKFVQLIEAFFANRDQDPDGEARQRMVIERLTERWKTAPPEHPVIVAGSTGSRGATGLLMQAVARLPQGAVILPGVDFDMPDSVWGTLNDAMSAEDHPQYRFARLLQELELRPSQIAPWHDTGPASPARNRLISLAMRPAPVTDQWLSEGRRLEGLAEATARMTLIEAESPRTEAEAIALALRDAAEQGRTAALITPDRTLTRQVTAALDRWGITPDDSAGRPLPLSAPGRFLRHVAELFGQKLTAETLLTLLKHPLTHSTGVAGTSKAEDEARRGTHLRYTRELELRLRRYGPAYPRPADLIEWAAKSSAERQAWAAWLAGLLGGLEAVGERSLSAHLEHHISLSEALAAGPGAEGSGGLWEKSAGLEAQRWVTELEREAGYAGVLSPSEFASLFHAVLRKGEVREAVGTHPGIMIWGTLEARVQGAELVILGGLNEGVWPEAAKPDPWLNRSMRRDAKLLLPERRIGLSAHDFQQAVAAPEVILTRSVRDAEAQTVPSRWVNRLTNLLGGLSEESAAALDEMKARGDRWLRLAKRLNMPEALVAPAKRPCPSPPVTMRPKELSITDIQRLIRDPYAIYARRVLGLSALNSLKPAADAPLRGIVIHKVLGRFIDKGPVTGTESDHARLVATLDEVLSKDVPWPSTQRLWRARLMRVADWFIAGEADRQADREPIAQEKSGALELREVEVTLTGRIDRVDRLPDGSLAVYDYKTGKPPSTDQQEHFDKQLLLSALMAEAGVIEDLAAGTVREVSYIGLGSSPAFVSTILETRDTGAARAELLKLLGAYQNEELGYTARRAIEKSDHVGDYDHLARFGEWDESNVPDLLRVGT